MTKKIKIGFGISTTPRRYDKATFLTKQIVSLMDTENFEHEMITIVDGNYTGVASSKNQALRFLYDSDCEYFFLFDDDFFPIKKGFEKFIIEGSQKSGIEHLLYLSDNTKKHKYIKSYKQNGVEVRAHRDCSGVFLFLTKVVLDKVGGYDSRFVGYGYNHIEYTNRINMAFGLPRHHYNVLVGTWDYFHSMDIDGEHKGYGEHKQTLSKDEMGKNIKDNVNLLGEKFTNKDIKYCNF